MTIKQDTSMPAVDPKDVPRPSPLTAARIGHNQKKALIKRVRRRLDLRQFLLNLLILAIAATIFGLLASAGLIERWYDVLISVTSEDRPWTHIMRDHWWIFWAAAVPLLGGLWWFTPISASRALWVSTAIFLIGFLGGHVFW